jgi:hypothetical protein
VGAVYPELSAAQPRARKMRVERGAAQVELPAIEAASFTGNGRMCFVCDREASHINRMSGARAHLRGVELTARGKTVV